MMLLMGMKMSLTKNPTKPMTTNPIAVRVATLVNSASRTNPDRDESVSDLRGRTKTTRTPKRSGAARRPTLAVGLVAALDEADAVLGEVAEGIHHRVDRVHGGRARSRGRAAWARRGRREDACGFAFGKLVSLA
jgi:hypothetical protein